MSPDWHEWHTAYDQPDSPLSQRLAIVQRGIGAALDAAPSGPIAAISMCAGQGRDLLGVLADHPRAGDVHGRLVELDPELATTARDAAPPRIDVLVGDAGLSDAYELAVPADLVLVCGVFGNVADADVQRTIGLLPVLCAPGATVIWTRHRREPDLTVEIRKWFAAGGFEEQAFITPEHTLFGVGIHRFAGAPTPFRPHVRLFSFVGYETLNRACPQCGYSYATPPVEIVSTLPVAAKKFVDVFLALDAAAQRRRPEPDVWSPLEYACHVRDVLQVMYERVELALAEHEPAFVPMGRDERVVNDRYNEQDPATVAADLLAAADALASLLAGLDDAAWARRGLYNYPTPTLRSIGWIGNNTIHELVHHRGDLSR